jgi:hypothetical protein
MIAEVSPGTSRFAALMLTVLLGWGALSLAFGAASARIAISTQAEEARESHASLRTRRVDIEALKSHLARLNASDAVQAIEAPNDRSAIGLLRQAARAAVEGANGKFLSSTDYHAVKVPDTIAVQIRARAGEASLSSIMRALEQGDSPMHIDDLQLTGRMQKDGAAEIEIVAVLRARWRTVEAPQR